ncbi:uncharacterized protein FSUBG_10927 [Fusarium subglutinans]|uniref:Aminoglycoside phosphotransferase domain-containing protein n=1 Tax=Gibberella subglutinans TaxID=42677 RepID=A0A8H5LEA5_GIBSU|nr:uncharacterized protein FSUBG_10927 [Fusarium subglutinans]KAF5590089.1 hypothetical protein FSUBG_10927 [Fusarium subglutinans]
MATENLIPDYNILSGIPMIKDSVSNLENTVKERCNVILSNFTTCTFSIHLNTPAAGSPEHVLVRLESSSDRFSTVAALQKLAHFQLPDLVPRVLDVGKTSTAQGQRLEYSVTEFISNAITLEQEWDKIDGPAQKDLMSSVIDAVSKLQNLTLDSEHAQKTLEGTSYYCDGKMAFIGGPELGYHSDIAGFLAKLAGSASPDKTNFSATRTSNSFVVESKIENVDRVELTSSDLVELRKHVVFCHDDLEPRNILIKRDNAHSGKWNIAAIIDWEMAGFFPFAYEYGHKDAELGSSNLHFTYYTLFKEQSRHLLAGGKSAMKLLEALRAMDVSKKSCPTKNVSRRFQARWLEREKVELSPDVQVGWVRKAGVEDVGVFTKQENEDIEMEILKELGYV